MNMFKTEDGKMLNVEYIASVIPTRNYHSDEHEIDGYKVNMVGQDTYYIINPKDYENLSKVLKKKLVL